MGGGAQQVVFSCRQSGFAIYIICMTCARTLPVFCFKYACLFSIPGSVKCCTHCQNCVSLLGQCYPVMAAAALSLTLALLLPCA